MRVGQAERYVIDKKFDDAKKSYSDLVQEFPNFPNMHYAYGRFLLAVDNPEEAIPQFKQEIANNPRHVRARIQVAAATYRLDSSAGIPYAQEVVKLEPRYPFGHYLLGLLYLDAGDVKSSIPQLETAASMVPREAQFQFALGNAYARAGRKQDAARARASFTRLGGKNKDSPSPSAFRELLQLDSSAGSSPKAKQP